MPRSLSSALSLVLLLGVVILGRTWRFHLFRVPVAGPGCGSRLRVCGPGCEPRLRAPVVGPGCGVGAVRVAGWAVVWNCPACLGFLSFSGMTSGPQVWGPAIPPPCSPTVQVPGPFRGPEVPGPGSGGPVPWPVPGPVLGARFRGPGSGARFQAPVRGFSEWEGFWVGVPTSSTVNLLQALSVSSSHSRHAKRWTTMPWIV